MFTRFFQWLRNPAPYALGGILIVGGIGGILFWGAFNTAMEETNTLGFCISCHEMESTLYQEYKQTIHYKNRTGIRATCSDCHVPHEWVYKVARKISATRELYHKALGTISTPEKFEAKRLSLAKNVWRNMKKTDSRECRNCHTWEAMSGDLQKLRARKQHQEGRDENLTCIDCHKGIAHRPVHKLLDEDVDDFYDGKDDPRRLPVIEQSPENGEASTVTATTPVAATKTVPSTPVSNDAASAPSSAPGSPGGDVSFEGIAGTDVTLFYPGQTSWEWVLKGSDHGGGRALRKLEDRCMECHRGEEADMGARIVGGEKAEETPIPGKRPSIAMNVKAVHDGETLKLRFQWPDTDHVPVPFVDGGKMDPENQIKLAFMLDDGKVEEFGYAGCWASCHHDSRYMPHEPDAATLSGDAAAQGALDLSTGVTKYMPGSRTEIDFNGRDGARRGGWNKLKDAVTIDTMQAEGAFVDLVRFSSGSNQAEEGSILAQRMLKSADNITGIAILADGVWTVEISRPLKSSQPGGVDLGPGKLYTIGFAIHDDYTSARFHHVSLEYKLGIDNPDAEINVVRN
jgi:cytochrome c-type protein NapC